jgi:cytochrome b involved in lipid metabolism
MFGNSSSAPKVELLPPKDDKFTLEELAKYNGQDSSLPIYVAVKDTVFDVSTSSSYGPEGGYKMFAGKNPNKVSLRFIF